MNFANEFDIEVWVTKYSETNRWNTPNLARAAETLAKLAEWTNDNSDGWAYWPKPCRAANKLITLLQSVDRFNPEDCTEYEYLMALRPIKSFMTREGIDRETILA